MNDTQTFTDTIRQIITDLERLDRRLLAYPDMLIEDTDDDNLGDIDYPTTEEDSDLETIWIDDMEEDVDTDYSVFTDTDEEDDMDIDTDEDIDEDGDIEIISVQQMIEEVIADEEDPYNNKRKVGLDVRIRLTDEIPNMDIMDNMMILQDTTKFLLRCMITYGDRTFTRRQLLAYMRLPATQRLYYRGNGGRGIRRPSNIPNYWYWAQSNRRGILVQDFNDYWELV